MPYRTPGREDPDLLDPGAPRRDDVVLAVLLVVLGSIRVAIALGTRESFGAEATVATAMLILGVALVARRR